MRLFWIGEIFVKKELHSRRIQTKNQERNFDPILFIFINSKREARDENHHECERGKQRGGSVEVGDLERDIESSTSVAQDTHILSTSITI